MINDSLKLYFLIAPALYLVNTIIATTFSIKYKNDSIYRKSAAIWFFYLVLGVSQGALQDVDIKIRTLAWSFCSFLVISSMAVFISNIHKLKYNLRKDIFLFTGAFLATPVLFYLKLDFIFCSLPSTFFAAYPILKFIPHLKNYKNLNFTKIGTLICYILIALHVVDYAYAADKAELLFPGYLLALMLATGASCFTFACLVERVILENEVRDILQNTSRLTALGGMAAEISHEIKNPLTVLTLNNSQMLNKIKNNQQSIDVEYFTIKLEVASTMLKRLIEIMNSLRSHYNSGVMDNFKKVKIKDLFSEAALMCDFRSKKLNINVEFHQPNDEALIECRSVQLIQVIQNIIQNAMDELSETANPKIEIKANVVGGELVKISISDNGPGIPDNIKPFIFDSFFTTKPHDKGSGLGLSISKRFIEEHGGSLYLADEAKTCFVIILPLSQKIVLKDHKKTNAS